MAKKKEEVVVEEKVVEEKAVEAKKSSANTYELKDKSYTHIIIDGKLIEVVDGKVTTNNKEAIKGYIK